MLTVETWHEIRLRAAQGASQRAIARALGLSRNTVAAALADDGPPTYSRTKPRLSGLDPFRETIAAGLRRGLAGVRLLEEVRDAGYHGSDATFYRWLADLKATERARPAACRFETDPGEQAQFDWSPYSLTLASQCTKLVIYSLLLAYSRRVHFFPSLAEDQEAVFEGVEAGFWHFGGVCRSLLVDNAKVFVVRHQGADLLFNPHFRALCGHYAVQPIAGTPYHPQGKGKVENPFGHLERRFLVGREWRDFDHFEAELAAFEEAWEERVHGTTKVPPTERFAAERSSLLPLPRARFVPSLAPLRQVSNDGLVSVGNVRYYVPAAPVGQRVRVRTLQGRTLVVEALDGTEIVRHLRQPRGTPPVLGPAAHSGVRRPSHASLSTLLARCRTRYASHSALVEPFLQRLMTTHPSHPEHALARILALLEAVPDALAVATLSEAVTFRLCTPAFLEELLRRRLRGARATPREPGAPPPLTQLALPALDVERPLALYGQALPAPAAEPS